MTTSRFDSKRKIYQSLILLALFTSAIKPLPGHKVIMLPLFTEPSLAPHELLVAKHVNKVACSAALELVALFTVDELKGAPIALA